MSEGHVLVCGEKIYKTPIALQNFDKFKLGTDYTNHQDLYATVDDLRRAMLMGVSSQFDLYASITILGYAFDNERDVNRCIEEFMEIQDVLVQNRLKSVKLYIITKDSDFYNSLKSDYNGMNTIFYANAEVFLLKDMNLSDIQRIMSGTRDGMGLRAPKKETLTKVQRVEIERQRLEEEAMQVEKETLEYEKDVPQSKLNREDYIGTGKANEKLTRLEKERQNAVRKAQRLGLDYYIDSRGDVEVYDEDGYVIDDIDLYEKELRQAKRNTKKAGASREEPSRVAHNQRDYDYDGDDYDEEGIFTDEDDVGFDPIHDRPTPTQNRVSSEFRQPTPRVAKSDEGGRIPKSYPVGRSDEGVRGVDKGSFTQFKENVTVASMDTGTKERVESLATVKMLFDGLLSDGMNITEEKLHDDTVVMAVSGIKGSGGSGLTAQIAEVYAMLGRSVCIIDLDLNGRGQTYYFSNYDEKVAENKGIANALINVMEGGVINKASVSVNSRIDVCGVSTSFGLVDERFKETIARNLNSVLLDAKDFYDIVLVDLPIEDFNKYSLSSLQSVERFLFVAENKEYEIEKLFREYLGHFVGTNGMLISDIFNNATIVLNKFENGNRDQQGYLINKNWLKEKLYEKGSPYDAILVSGEIPNVSHFENQYLTNQRYVWEDSGYLATIKMLLKEAV